MEDQIEATFVNHSDAVRDLAIRLRKEVLKVLPGIREKYFSGWGMIGYHHADGGMKDQVCYIKLYRKHINLGFMHGTDIPDPHGLLEGTGKRLRHVKLLPEEKIDWKKLRELLREARDFVAAQGE